MKNLYSLLLVFFVLGSVHAQYNVTFQVDMSGQTVSPNGVHVAGNFQAAAGFPSDWTPGATSLTNSAGSIYEVTVNIPSGTYEYKFINDNDWPGVEAVPAAAQVDLGQGNDNRWMMISSDTTLPAYMFGGAAPAGMKGLTMVVDLSQQSSVSDSVSVAGSFQSPNQWTPGVDIMADLKGDSVFRYTAFFMPNTTYEWKFLNGPAWGSDESVPGGCAMNGNRFASIANDSIYGPVCFGQCASCFIPDTFNITIQVDMNGVCGFNDTVDIAGPFNGWPGTLDPATMLTDADNDGIWEITIRATAPEFTYKARYHANGNTNWEGGNNKVITFSKDTVVPVRCFNNDAYGLCPSVPAPADITFMVDVTTFPNPTDLNDVYIIGDFTQPAWQGGKVLLTPVAGMPGVFGATINDVCPGKISYKFMNTTSANVDQEEDFATLVDSSCTEPSGVGGLNRIFVRPDAQPQTLAFKWNSCEALPVGLEDHFARTDLSIYPNPFNGQTTIELNDEELFDLNMIDITGKSVHSASGISGQYTLNVPNVKAGVYYLKVTNEKGETNINKVIVQ